MDKVAIVKDVSLKLSDAEAAIDEAIAKTARLIDGLMVARGTLRLSTTAGGRTGEKLAQAMSTLMAARAETAGAHEELAELQTRMGLRRLDLSADFLGPLDKPPAPSFGEPTGPSAEVSPIRRAS